MKKINNKGMTLAELIVSFALVAVAVIYFSQTIIIIRKMYVTSRKDTNNFADVNYAFRLIDEAVKENNSNICSTVGSAANIDIDKGTNKYVCNYTSSNTYTPYETITFSINGKAYTYYHYINNSK